MTDIDPREDAEYGERLRFERLAQAAREDARRMEASRLWTPPPWPTTLYDQLAEVPPKTDWVMHDLAPAGIVMVNAQAKGGKTTLLINAAFSMVENVPFLNRFKVNLQPDERIGYLNMELPKGQMNEWFRDLQISDEGQKRLEVYHSMEYGLKVLDFSNDRAVEWVIKWLTDNGITVLFADPLAKLYNPARWMGAGGDVNAAFTQWFNVLEDIQRIAKLRLVWIAHHTGFSEEAADRSRGASSMMDNPTVNMILRHNGGHAGKPKGNERWLKAWGRAVDVDEFEIGYDPIKRRLFKTGGSGTRADSASGWRALEAYDAMVKYTDEQRAKGVVGDIELTSGQLSSAVGLRETDKASSEHRRGRNLAVDRGWLAERRDRTTKLYRLGEITPSDRGGKVDENADET